MVSARRFSRGASGVMRQAVAKCIYDIADIICVLDTHAEVMWPSSPRAELLYVELCISSEQLMLWMVAAYVIGAFQTKQRRQS